MALNPNTNATMAGRITAVDANNYDDVGAADVYVLDVQTNQQGPQSYFDGMECIFIANNSNTVASTANVNGIGIVDIAGTAVAGTIVAGILAEYS